MCFDVWDTLIIDDSDEQIRKELGEISKSDERIQIYHDLYGEYSFEKNTIKQAVLEMEDLFRVQWKQQYITPSVSWRVLQMEKILGKHLGKPIMVNSEKKEQSILDLEQMELKFDITPLPGVRDALESLKSKYTELQLGIISDAIYSPGTAIRKILEKHHLLSFFDYFSFSDEVGHSKPSPKIFSHMCDQAQVSPLEMAHIGDRIVNDIMGVEEFGGRGVLCQVVKAKDEKHTRRFSHYEQLDQVIEGLFRSM